MRSVAGTELSREQYLIHLNADYQLLAAAIPVTPVEVPSCPGWTTNDLVKHMAHVYLGQAYVVETGSQAENKEHLAPYPRTEDFMEFMSWGFAAITKALDINRPERPTWSWHHSDHSVDFWFRRMAHETVIHRIDAEQAVGAVTKIDEALALDGVDEVLDFLPLLGSWPEVPNVDFGIVSIVAKTKSGSQVWDLQFTDKAATVSAADQVNASARLVVSGDAEAIDLYLWGRIDSSDPRISITGDGEETFKQLMQVAVL
jgi:uncharacterized protein (TIGR03083 family)